MQSTQGQMGDEQDRIISDTQRISWEVGYAKKLCNFQFGNVNVHRLLALILKIVIFQIISCSNFKKLIPNFLFFC